MTRKVFLKYEWRRNEEHCAVAFSGLIPPVNRMSRALHVVEVKRGRIPVVFTDGNGINSGQRKQFLQKRKMMDDTCHVNHNSQQPRASSRALSLRTHWWRDLKSLVIREVLKNVLDLIPPPRPAGAPCCLLLVISILRPSPSFSFVSCL